MRLLAVKYPKFLASRQELFSLHHSRSCDPAMTSGNGHHDPIASII
jgi:hypothetical protein